MGMHALWHRVREALTMDDLFWRVSCFLFAALAAAIGVLICWVVLKESIWWPWQALLWAVAAGLCVWAVLLLGGCFSAPGSRWAKRARHATPSTVDIEGGVPLTVVVVLFPAAVLTILLRCIGVRGCKSARGRSALLLR
jgi:hypothetical protein